MTGASPPDIPDQLRRLAELRDQGVLTVAEFEAKKADLLARDWTAPPGTSAPAASTPAPSTPAPSTPSPYTPSPSTPAPSDDQPAPVQPPNASASRLWWRRRSARASIAIAGLLAVVAYSAMGQPRGSSGPDGETGTTSVAGAEGGAGARVDLGQAVEVGDGLTVTVLEARYSTGLEDQEPPAGQIWVAYKVRYEATSSETLLSSSDWTALADGTKQGQSAFVINEEWEPWLPFDTLRAGATAEGWITFSVPQPSSSVTLIFENDVFGSTPKLRLTNRCCS